MVSFRYWRLLFLKILTIYSVPSFVYILTFYIFIPTKALHECINKKIERRKNINLYHNEKTITLFCIWTNDYVMCKQSKNELSND